MHILFIHSGQESLGIEYLSSALKKNSHDVTLLYEPLLFRSFRFNIPFLDKNSSANLASKAINRSPDLICFSVESDYYGWALEVASQIKNIKNTPILFGGIHPSSVPNVVIEEECVDYLCIGEGEEAIVELASRLESNAETNNILNIWSKISGNIFRNPIKDLRQNLDELPFPDKDLFYDVFPYFVNDAYSIVASRGCYNNCTYCYNSMLRNSYKNNGKYLRNRSVENVISELKHAKDKYNIKRVAFCDDVFATDIDWLEKFIDQYKKLISLPFYCQAHPSFINKKKIELLVSGGCSVVNFGIQTLNEDLRNKYLHRYGSNKEIIEALKLFRETNIFLFCNYIFGLPHQDLSELKNIVNFCSEQKVGFHDVNWLRYYPGTEIVFIAAKENILTSSDVEEINQSKSFKPYAHGGHSITKERSQLRNLVFLSHIFPEGFTKYILKKGLHSLLPTFNIRNAIVIPRLLFMKYFRGRRHPYPNFSISGSIKYYFHFLIFNNYKRGAVSLARTLKRSIRPIINMFYLRKIINKRTFFQILKYFIFRYVLRKKIPGTAILAPTFRCQCDCACCSAGIFRKFYKDSEEMSLDTIKCKIEEIGKLGVPRIHLVGGEPLLRKDIVEIVKVASEQGLIVFLETNGLLLTEAMIYKLRDAGISSINISLDSYDNKKHDELRSLSGVFDSAVTAIQLCVKHKVSCIVSTYATKKNIYNGDLANIVYLARRLKCFGIRVIPSEPSGNWINREDVILSSEDCRNVETILPISFLSFNRTKLIKCPMRTGYKLFILPDGNIAPCEHLPYIFRDSKNMRYDLLVKTINNIEMFKKDYFCMPRDLDFRRKYLNGLEPENMQPIFIDTE